MTLLPQFSVKKLETVAFDSSIMKQIDKLFSRFLVKLISCIAFGSAASVLAFYLNLSL